MYTSYCAMSVAMVFELGLIDHMDYRPIYPASFQLEWYGLVESKVRHLVGNLEREAIDLAHVWPKTYPSLEPGKETRCCYWFIGLQLKTARKDDGTPQSLDLTVPIRKFTEVVMSSATTTVGMWREGMKVEAVYKRRKELAHYIPPDERYKLKAEKASRSQASLAAASRQPSSEQQQQQGLKRRNSSVEAASAAAVQTEQPTTAAEDAASENGNSSAPDTSSASSSVESRNENNSGSTAAVPSKENTASSNSRESSPPPVKRQKSPPPPTPTAAMTTTAVSSTEATKSIVENSNGVQVT